MNFDHSVLWIYFIMMTIDLCLAGSSYLYWQNTTLPLFVCMFRKYKFSVVIDYIIGWILALLFLFVLRNYGIPDYNPTQPTLTQVLGMILGFGILAGILFGYIQIYFEPFYERRLPI